MRAGVSTQKWCFDIAVPTWICRCADPISCARIDRWFTSAWMMSPKRMPSRCSPRSGYPCPTRSRRSCVASSAIKHLRQGARLDDRASGPVLQRRHDFRADLATGLEHVAPVADQERQVADDLGPSRTLPDVGGVAGWRAFSQTWTTCRKPA